MTTPTTPTDQPAVTNRRVRTALVAAALAGGTLFGVSQLGGVANAQTDDTTDTTDTTAQECQQLRQERREERQAERQEHAEELATLLGIDTETLEEQLRSGETLADIATANGVSVQTVVDAIVADRTEHIEEAVADGKIDQERADELLADLEERVTERVEEGRPDRGDGPRGGRGGPRGGFGEGGPADDLEG